MPSSSPPSRGGHRVRGTLPLPLRPAPVPHPGRLLGPQRTQPPPRPLESWPKATPGTLLGKMRPSSPVFSPGEAPGQRSLVESHGAGHDSSGLAHTLRPRPRLPSSLRPWAVSCPRRLSATSWQWGCLRSRAWHLQTPAQSVFARSLLGKDVKARWAHTTSPTAPGSTHGGSGASD